MKIFLLILFFPSFVLSLPKEVTIGISIVGSLIVGIIIVIIALACCHCKCRYHKNTNNKDPNKSESTVSLIPPIFFTQEMLDPLAQEDLIEGR